MRLAGRMALLALAGLPTAALAADKSATLAADNQVFRGRLAENPNNMVACRGLDEQIEREHTVTISGEKVEYTAPGGTQLRFGSKGPGLWGTTEELGPERMRYTFSPATGAFTIRENNLGCIWSGTLKPQP